MADPRETARRVLVEALDLGEFRVLRERLAPQVLFDLGTGTGSGVAALELAIEERRRAFPDLAHSAVEIAVDGPLTLAAATTSGTMLRPLAGLAPTGRRAVWREVLGLRSPHGVVAELWLLADRLAMTRRTGPAGAPRLVDLTDLPSGPVRP